MADPIRVLLAIGSMSGGGAERQMLRILNHLDRERFVPRLYLVQAEGELLGEIPPDVPVVSFSGQHQPPRLNFPGRIHRRQVRHFEHVVREFDAEVVYDRTYFMTMIAAPGCRRCGVPRLSVIDCEPRQDFESTAGRFVAIKRQLLRRAYRAAERTLAVSEGVRRAAIDYFALPPDKVATMYNFIDLERIDRLAAEDLPDWETGRFHVVACGRLHAQKGFAHLLDAVADLVHRRGRTQLLLHILGSGPLRDELAARIDAARIRPYVRLHGFVANPFPFFRHAQLFCLSSLYEGFGLVLAEAMACRVPVLSTDCPSGPREVLADGRFGRLIPPGDTRALPDAIEDAIANYARWIEPIEAARTHVEQNFSPAARVGELENLLAEFSRRRDSSNRATQSGR